MAKNRADIRKAIRAKLSAWPDLQTTLAEALDASETDIDLTAVTSVKERSLIEVDSEVLHVLSVASTTATVWRAARGTTAATHSNGAAVKVYPEWGWTDDDLNAKISKAIAWLGECKVWSLVPKTNTFLSGYREFGLPAGVEYPHGNHVKVLEVLQTDGTYLKSLQWKQVGDRIILPYKLGSSIDVRIWIEQNQPDLTDDSTNLDEDKYLEILEMYVAGRCLEELIANRSRYTEYSASLHDRASSLDELQRQAYYFQNQATILADKMSRPGLSGQASFHPA